MIKDGVYQTAAARPIVRAGRRGDYFEIKPENMFEMVPADLIRSYSSDRHSGAPLGAAEPYSRVVVIGSASTLARRR